MIDKFDVKNLNKSSAKFDLEKLKWLNQQHLMNTNNLDLAEFLTLHSTLKSKPTTETLISFVEAYKPRVNSLNQLLSYFDLLYAEDFLVDDDIAQKYFKETIIGPLKDLVEVFGQVEWNTESIHQAISNVCKQYEIGFGKIGQPLRVAITGGTQSPSIDLTITILERKIVIQRLITAIEYITISTRNK
jgi:glutamyl-tRNA synthetase